jgi:crotonobetaine/carnitine-CoA ligase
MLDNCVDFPAIAVGAALGGIVLVPVNTEYVGQILRHILTQSAASVMVTSARFVDRIADVRPATLRQILLVDGLSGDDDPSVAPVALDVEGTLTPRTELDELAIMYTSGTTGPSKGGVISERHAYMYTTKVADLLSLTSDDVYYGTLPMFHVAGLWGLFYASMHRGAECVLTPRFSVSRFWADCLEVGATKTFLLGAMAQFLLRSESAPLPGGRLERMLIVPLIDELELFKNRFGVTVSTSYASTEVNLPLAQPDGTDAQTSVGVGVPRPGFAIRLVRNDGRDAAVGEVGELWVKADEARTTLVRYHKNPEATQQVIVDGWVHSGDTFRQDADGNFHFVDRLKDALRKRGENISSFEVESEVRSHPAVLECAVVGVASSDTEQEIAAFIVLRPGMTATREEIRTHVAGQAPRFMVPDHVHFINAFPQTPNGKIKKYELRGMASSNPSAAT